MTSSAGWPGTAVGLSGGLGPLAVVGWAHGSRLGYCPKMSTRSSLFSDEALALADQVLASVGEPIDESRLADDKHQLRAVVGSGSLNFNPAVVTLQLVATAPTSTRIRVRGVAKEGLIPQRAGRKAAERVAEALRIFRPS